MDKCHKHVALLAPRLIQNKSAFENNDKKEIKRELHNIINRIQHIIYSTKNLRHIIDTRFPISEIFREFYYIIYAYLVEPICKVGDRDYRNIIRDYLCEHGARNLVILYHFIANVGIIESGCTRIYLYDRTKKMATTSTETESMSTEHIINDENTFVQNINNPLFRISKSEVKKCIERVATKDINKLLIARTLLAISKDFRTTIEDFCPVIYNTWTTQSKLQHETFEKYLGELITTIDRVTK